MSDLAEIKALLTANAEALARELVPDGHRSGKYYIGRCPWRPDTRPGSFWVNLAGMMSGTYHDAATQETGDLVRLIEKTIGLDFPGALKWARGWLGLGEITSADRRRRVEVAQKHQADDAADAAARIDAAKKSAFAVWLASKKHQFIGSPADTYLQTRGIHLATLTRMPGCLGWLPEQRHVETATSWAVMVAGVAGPDGKISAIHRTFLDVGGRGKAPVAPQRKIWPSFAGGAIRLWRGSSKLSIDGAARCGLRETLVLTEGVEDGLSVVMADPEYRVWCACTLGNLAAIKLPECIDEVVVCADNDWGKPQAARALKRAIGALAAQDVRIKVARSHIGKDVNDALRGGS